MDKNELYILGRNELQIMDEVVACNQFTQRFGLQLTREDAAELIKERRESLQKHGRVEFGRSILPALIFAFCDSVYMEQDQYVEMLERLQDIFYFYKSESLDILTDDELITYMKEHFEGDCQGSLDHLEDTCLEQFVRNIRETPGQFMRGGKKDDNC